MVVVSRLGTGCHGPHFDEAEAQTPQRVNVARVLVEPSRQANTVGKVQAEEIDAGTSPGGLNPATARLRVSRTTASDKPLQLVPREQVPQPQRRERKGLRPVRIETKQPRADQAI
jgi:hypothetical protein